MIFTQRESAKMETQQVLNTLTHILSPDDTIRRQAEHTINLFSHQANYVFALAQITTSNDSQIPLHLRQLAGVLLKSHVHNYWVEKQEETSIEQQKIVISQQERQVLKENLPKTLGNQSSKISTTVVSSFYRVYLFVS
jgi:hypothetical protein